MLIYEKYQLERDLQLLEDDIVFLEAIIQSLHHEIKEFKETTSCSSYFVSLREATIHIYKNDIMQKQKLKQIIKDNYGKKT